MDMASKHHDEGLIGDAESGGTTVATVDSWEEFRAKQGPNSEMKPTLKYPQISRNHRKSPEQITASYPSRPWSRLEKQRDFNSPLEGN